MSRLIATTADEMLSGAFSSVMGMFWKNDDEVPGVVVLSSANMMPNPDLVDLNERSRLRAWYMDAPPSPDSWNVYMKQTHTLDGSGNRVYVGNDKPMLRQNTSLLRMKQHTYQQDHALLTDKALPDLSKDEDEENDLAPPLDRPRVEKKTKASAGGYPAGDLWASYAGILGDHPHSSKRLTSAAPAVKITGIIQGQSLIFYMPSEIPDSWSGVAFLVGDTASTMRVQRRVDVRGRVLTEIKDNGPYRKDGTQVGTDDSVDNRTKMGSFEQLSAPKHWRTNSNRTLKKGNYPIAYQLKTDQGWTASSQAATVKVANDQKGEVIAWTPHDSALKKPGIQRWRPLFKGKNDNWYTFEDAKENGYSLQKVAHIHTRNTDGEKWQSSNGAKKTKRSEKDSSGVPGPTDPMETPLATGAESMAPGRYAIRVTTSSSKLGMESRPSPRKTIDLVETSAGSGVTNQLVRVFRPPGQTIKNSRLVEVDPANGTTELHWTRFTTTNVTTTGADGLLSVDDTTSSITTQDYRRSSIEPIDATKYYSVRFRMNVTRHTTPTTQGRVRIKLAFYHRVASTTDPVDLEPDTSTFTLISETTLEDFRGTQTTDVKYSFGPQGGSAQYDIPTIPAGSEGFVQLVVQGVGASGDTRNFAFTMSNIGLYVGRSHPRKVYDLTLAEDTDPVDSWPVDDVETPKYHYPHGPYIRVLKSPTSPAQERTYTLITGETKGFEDGTATGGGWTASTPTTGLSFTVDDDFALYGSYGAQIQALNTSTIGYSAFVYKSFFDSVRSTFGLEGHVRIKALPSAGTLSILGVSRDTGTTNYLAHAQISNTGVLSLVYWNGTAMTTVAVPNITVQAGDDLRLDFGFTGLRTASGSVFLRVKRNDRAPEIITVSSLNWSAGNPGGNVYNILAGIFNGSTAAATSKIILDRIRPFTGPITIGSNIPGNAVEYWAPEKQPAGDPDHFLTGVRFPVKPGTTYVDSVYMAHDGITTPSDGAKFFRVVSYDSDGEMLVDHGYILEGAKGKSHWDRYWMSYTTPSIANGDDGDAAYVEYTRNHVGDGLIWAMGFQHQTGTTPTAFDNTNALSGSFNVIFETPIKGGPMGGDISFTKEFTRMRAVTTYVLDSNGDPQLVGGLDQVSLRARGAGTVASLSVAPWQTDITKIPPYHKYVEVEVTMRAPSNTTSPEVRSVFIDAKRVQPVLTHEDGRDFWGGVLVYALTPASPIPNVVRSEYADGSVGLKNVGRGKPPEKLKLSLEALTEAGKRGVEKNPATDNPLFGVETDEKRFRVGMLPEFTGNIESRPDGTEYWDYVAEDIEADVFSTEDY